MESKYFKIQELVSPQTFEKFGEGAWIFISPKWITILDTIREHFGKPVIINNWHTGGQFKNRGLRVPGCGVGKETSQHYQTPLQCSDFNVSGVSDIEVKKAIMKDWEKFYKLGVRRMESHIDAPTWCHLDCKETNQKTIILFRA